MNPMIVYLILGLAQGPTTPPAASATVRGGAGGDLREEIGIPDRNLPPPPYTERRWIGKLKKSVASCPQANGWESVSMLQLTVRSAPRVDPDPLRKLGLDRFCIFTATAGEPFPPELRDQLEKSAERDRMALSAMAKSPMGPVGEKVWRTLADQFTSQVGQVALDPEKAHGVRLVFLDTHPTGEGLPAVPDPPKSWHGYSMAHLANRILCPKKECPIEFATRLALRYDNYSEDMVIDPPEPAGNNGGHLGLVGDLAMAIFAEVAHWQDLKRDPGYDKKLILNLSIGWDSELLKELKAKKLAKLESSVQLVYKALEYAAGQGALVIASAGNRRGGQTKSISPVLPAGWELRRPRLLPLPCGRKLIYAVGGLDWQGLPLSNSRDGAKPRRMAYGDHAVAATSTSFDANGSPTLESPTMIYTGTSVSAAVTSSIAAAVWSLQPELRRAGVMRRIFHSAEILKGKADYYAWKWFLPQIAVPHLREVSLCRAILQVCGPQGDLCEGLSYMDCRLGNRVPAQLAGQILSPPDKTPLDVTQGTPLDQYLDLGSMAAATVPQPGSNPCPGCTLVPEPDDPDTNTPQQLQANTLAFARLEGTVASLDGPESWPYLLDFEVLGDWQPTTLGAPVNPQIDSAVLRVTCGQTMYERDLKPQVSFPLSGPFSQTFYFELPEPSVANCVASVDFEASYPSQTIQTYSVQSPVGVDP